jgi:hypothetical protein
MGGRLNAREAKIYQHITLSLHLFLLLFYTNKKNTDALGRRQFQYQQQIVLFWISSSSINPLCELQVY